MKTEQKFTGIDLAMKYDSPVEQTIDVTAAAKRDAYAREFAFFHGNLFEPMDNMQMQCYSEAAVNGWHDDDAKDGDTYNIAKLREIAGNDPVALASLARIETVLSSGYIDQVAVRLLNIVSEAVEAWEGFRGRKPNAICDKGPKMAELGLPMLTNAEEEIADIIIRALDTAQVIGVNARRAVSVKLLFNRSRGHKHGNKAR